MTQQKREHRWMTIVRNRLMSGVLILLPFVVTILVVRWLFLAVFHLIRPLVIMILEKAGQIPEIGVIPPLITTILVTILSIVLLATGFYLVGSLGRWILVRRLVETGEAILLKIPLIRTIFSPIRQGIRVLTLSEKETFKKVVLVEFPRRGFQALGFLTGTLTDDAGKIYCTVFVPTSPNPTNGFFEIIPREEVIDTDMTIEGALSMILSGGLVSPSCSMWKDER